MPVDLAKYRADNAGFYGQSSLADVAADLHKRSGSARTGVAFEDFARLNGFDAQIARESQPKPQPQQQPGYGLPAYGFWDDVKLGAKVIGQGLYSAAADVLPKTAAEVMRGGDVPLHPEETATGRMISEQQKDLERWNLPPEQAERNLFGIVKAKDVQAGLQSLGYSAGSMVAGGLAGGAAGSVIPGAGNLAGVVAGSVGAGLAGGAVGYRATKDQFVEDIRQRMLKADPSLTEERWADAKKAIEGDAQLYGMWEAVPEAVGNALTWGIIKTPVGSIAKNVPFIKNGIARAAASAGVKLGLDLPVELGTEAWTQHEQGAIEAKQGLRESAPTWGEAFDEVAPQTAVTTLATLGLGHAANRLMPGTRTARRDAKTAVEAVQAGGHRDLSDEDLNQVYARADALFKENPGIGLRDALLELNAEQLRRQGEARGFPLNEFLADEAARAAAAQAAAQPQEAADQAPEDAATPAGPDGPDRGAELAALSKSQLNDLAATLGIAKPGRVKRDELVASVLQAEEQARRWNDPEAVDARYQEAHAAPFPGQVDSFLEGVAPAALPEQTPAAAPEPEPEPATADRAAELSGLAYSKLRNMAAALGVEKPGRLKRDALVPAIVAAEEQARQFYDLANLDARYQETHAAPFPGQMDGFLDGASPVGQPQPAEGRASGKRQPKAAAEQPAPAASATGEIPLVEVGAAPETVQAAEPAAQQEPRPALVEQSPAGVLPSGEVPLLAVGEKPAGDVAGQARDVAGYPPVDTGQPQADIQGAQAAPAAEDLKARSKKELNALATSLGIERPVAIRRDDLVGQIEQARQAAAGPAQEQPGAAGAPQTAKVWSGDTLREVPVVEHDGVKTVNVMGQGMPPRYAVLNALAGSDEHQISQHSGNTPAEAVAAARRPPEPPHPMNAATRGQALQALPPDQQNALGKALGIKPGRKSRLGFLEAIFDTPELKLRAAYDAVVGKAGQPVEAGKLEGVAAGGAQGAVQKQAAVPSGEAGAIAGPATEVPVRTSQNSPAVEQPKPQKPKRRTKEENAQARMEAEVRQKHLRDLANKVTDANGQPRDVRVTRESPDHVSVKAKDQNGNWVQLPNQSLFTGSKKDIERHKFWDNDLAREVFQNTHKEQFADLWPARYSVYRPGAVKRPTPHHMGLGKGSSDSWIAMEAGGRKGWTDGHLADLGELPYKENPQDHLLDRHSGPTDFSRILERVNSSDPMLTPRYIQHDDWGSKIIFTVADEDRLVSAPLRDFSYFASKYGEDGFTLHQREAEKPIGVVPPGESAPVGLFAPMKQVPDRLLNDAEIQRQMREDSGKEGGNVDSAPKEEARDEPASGIEQNESSAAESRPEEAAGAAPPEQSEKIGLALGEKIGGSRKDTAAPTGPRVRLPGKDDSVPAWKKRFMAVQVSETGFRSGEDKTYWSIADQKGTLRTGRFKFDSKEEAEAAIPLAAVSLKHRVTKRGDAWEIYRKVTDRKTVVIKDGFATEEDAKRYMAEHAEDILNTKTGFGEEILARPEKVFREGASRRDGPAKGQDFLDAFGFRGVEFGEWNDQAERQEVLNHAYDGLLDLAEILNVPPKALSLNGDLALAFGSRGRGLSSAKAHYERDYGVINLTKLTGAGSLAHEWYHALDHYLGRQDTKASSEKVENKRGDQVFAASDTPSRDYLSHGASRKSQVREALRAAYEKLLGDIAYKAEQYREDTEKAEQFVSRARGYLERNLKDIRTGLTQETQWGRKRAPATAEQLARFDALAEQLLSGDNLALEMRSNEAEGRQRSRFGSYRSSNDILDALAAIYKEVRGRSGFNAERTDPFNSLAANIQDFARRAKMLEDARSKTEKTKQIPTEYRRAAYLMDQGRTSDYWSEPHEMAARAFSAYVEDKVAQDGGRSDFLVYGANNAMPEYRLVNVRPFPEGAEREAINAAFDKFFETVQTKETDKGIAMFRRGEGSGSPASPLARAVAAELHQGVAQFPALRGLVDVYQSEADMPADLREAVEEAGVSGRFHGAYDAETKRIALVAGNIPTVKAGQTAFVQTLLRHEGRHAGLDRVLGGSQEREEYMRKAAQAMPREVSRWLTRHGLDSTRQTRAEAAEEILVSWAKDGTVHRALDRLLSKLAAWVRSIFPTLELTRAELRQLLAQADDFVDGKGLDFIAPLGQPFSAAPAFSRTDEAEGYSVEEATMPREARTFGEARRSAREFVGQGLENNATGMVATVSNTNIAKMLSLSAVGKSISPGAQSHAVANLDRLFAIAGEPDTHADRDGSPRIDAIHRFYAPMIHNGEVLVAKMTVKEFSGTKEGNKIYSVEAMEIEKAARNREASISPDEQGRKSSPQAAFMDKIRALEAKVKGEDKAAGPRFARTGDLTGVPEEKRDVATWLKDEASANVRSILAGVHGLSETGVLGKMVRSPEYWQHPVLKRLYETFRGRTDRAHELLHKAFDVGDGRTIIQEAKDVLKDQKQRDILNEGVDHADVNEVEPEAMETWFAEQGGNEATIGLWRTMRERYDMLLDERLASYRKLIDKARSGYERKIVRRLIDAGIPADAAKAFDATGYNSDKTLADELAPYADEVKAVVAAARKAGVTIKGQLSDVRLHDENGTSFSFAEMVEKMGQLRGFYAPRLREAGDYVVRGQRTGEDGTVERFRAHKEWRSGAEKLRTTMARDGWDMEPVGKLDKLPEATQGLIKTLELAKTVESAVNQVGEDVDAGLVGEILENLADEVKARGFRSQSIRRSGRHGDVVQGYFKDAVERFARYAGSTAYGLAKMEAAEKAAKVLFGTAETPGLDIKKERDVYRLAVDYLAENLRNAESGDRVFALAKSVASLKYLGLNPKSALVNLSSMATSVPAALHAYAMQGKGGWARVGREIARSMYDYLGRMTGKWGRFTADEQQLLDEIRRESLDDPQFAREALSVYRDTAGRGWSWLMGKSMALFGATEQLNRGATLLAGYRLARTGGADHATAVARAREASDRAHGVYDRATQPAWTWGTGAGARVGQAWYVYKKYGHNYLQLVQELFAKKDWQAATFALAAPAVLGGLGGHVLTSLAKALVAAGGGDDDPEKWVYDFLGKNVGGGAEDLARFGLLGLATGADMSGSLGTMIDMPDTWSDVLGPMGGLGKDVLQAIGYLAGGQPGRAAEKALPSGVAKVLQAVRESDQGVTTGKNYPVIGEDGKPLRPTAGESVAKGLGFRPLREARARDRTSEAITEERRFGDRRDTIYARFRAFALDGGRDAGERQALVTAVADFNQDVAEAGLAGRVSPITRESLLRQTERLARPTKREQARLSSPAGRAEAAPTVTPLEAGDIEGLSHPYYELRRTYLDAKVRYDALRDAGDLKGAMAVRSETRLPRLRALVGRVQSIHADMAELRTLRLNDAVKARRMELLREREKREMDRAARAWGAMAANGE